MKSLKPLRVLALILPFVLVASGCNGTTDGGSSSVSGFSISKIKFTCWQACFYDGTPCSGQKYETVVSTKIAVTGKIKNNTRKRAKVHLEASYYDSPDASDNPLWAGSFWEPTDSYIAPGATKNFSHTFTGPAGFYTQICVPATHHNVVVTDVDNA